MNSYTIHERASDKAFAKITMLKIEAEQLNDDIKLGIKIGRASCRERV